MLFRSISLGAIAAVWWWLATPITLARAPIDPNAKLLCVSYAPFREGQTPLVLATHIAPEQIAQDLAQLAKISDCVRTYSIENGLDQVPAIAAKVGLKVIQGIWLGSNRLKNLAQISTVVRLTKEYPGVITAVVVGNEVLLRGEMTTSDLAPPSVPSNRRYRFRSPTPMCGNIGFAIGKSMKPSILSRSTSCPTGKISRSARNMPPPMSTPSASEWRWRFRARKF